MYILRRAVSWAVAILFVAVAKHMGIMDAEAADVMLLVLPLVAVTTIFGRRTACFGEPRS